MLGFQIAFKGWKIQDKNEDKKLPSPLLRISLRSGKADQFAYLEIIGRTPQLFSGRVLPIIQHLLS